ncbi:MAG: hypothetical protein KAR45_21770 [Desulfobacteraceae bacterium]|nr:hypothetical protein [Desulfobacteraceae bacterium]
MGNSNRISGNLLGGSRAEIDGNMLQEAFVETSDFLALVNTKDFNFVVGRRGTGKSALFIKIEEHIIKNKIGYVYSKVPEEYEQLALQHTVKKITEQYDSVRAITRVAWRVAILLDQLLNLENHYKFKKSKHHDTLIEYKNNFENLFKLTLCQRTSEIIASSYRDCSSPEMLPGRIANTYKLDRLQNSVDNALRTINRSSYYLFDGLDEGWHPNEIATAVLGGLTSCAADMLDKQSEIHNILFIRDNIFRSLNYFDRDFSRHIEGNTLRLTWDEASLLHLVTKRLRKPLNLESIESDIKVWNRLAKGNLKNRDGFRSCLKYTLYRPRDIIVLLNTTFAHIERSDRHEIIDTDIELSSKQISSDRLNDLIKEYDKVFPGLSLLVNIFKGQLAFQKYSEIVLLLDSEITNNNYLDKEASDYAMLGTGKEAFFALYSVGFVGIENPETRAIQFCHDGSSAELDASKEGQRSCVHPCYWKALSIQSEKIEENILIEIYDNNQPASHTDLKDYRTKRIGKILSALPTMNEGNEDSNKFEEWVLQAVKILFSGRLSNPELHANSDAIQRRDVIATNDATEGFWKKIREDYKSRQIVFEAKNFSTLKIDNFRQASSYSGKHYGNFIIIVNRAKNEGLSNTEKGWVKEFFYTHDTLIFLLPAPIISRCISKLRTKQRFDYTEDLLNKRLDTYLRSYLSIKHTTKKKTKKKK